MRGSSPRGRGTRDVHGYEATQRRFIPAWAGNTFGCRTRAPSRAVHPRVGGEHQTCEQSKFQRIGSSPRGRGTPSQKTMKLMHTRFIPAWAGNTPLYLASHKIGTVHPRVGGEHPGPGGDVDLKYGSSPRGRGTRIGRYQSCICNRFIPAWAGNTVLIRGKVDEHSGSSPHGRGTLEPVSQVWRTNRFIPAWAGNTRQISR